ncbi:hypothetical protein COI88_28740 [Bacillus cereus]|nr:hypothetical protein COI88_28740 [Bacillus cereus]
MLAPAPVLYSHFSWAKYYNVLWIETCTNFAQNYLGEINYWAPPHRHQCSFSYLTLLAQSYSAIFCPCSVVISALNYIAGRWFEFNERSNPICSRVHEDGTERMLKEYLLKIAPELIDTIKTIEKNSFRTDE